MPVDVEETLEWLEKADVKYLTKELEKLQAENARLKLLAAPEPPPGEWQKTHRVVAVRPAEQYDTAIDGSGKPRVYQRDSDIDQWYLVYILEPLEPPKPKFECPPHLKDSGYTLVNNYPHTMLTHGEQSLWYVGFQGVILDTGRAMGFTSIPELQPGQEMEL